MAEDQYQDITNLESDLEKAFKKLRKNEKSLKNGKKALVNFADRFNVCLNRL